MLLSARRFAITLILLCSILPSPASSQSVDDAGRPDKVLVVGTKEAPPFAMKTASGEWEGISIDLWRRIAEQLGWRYDFQEKTLADLLKGTADGSLDAAVGALTITADREKHLDFSQPFYETGLSIAVPKGHFSWTHIIQGIVSGNLIMGVLGLIGAMVMVGTVLWLIERRKNQHFGEGATGFISSLLWSAMTAIGHSHHKAPTTIAGELLAMLWILTSVIVVSTFTALIASALTTSQLRGTIHGIGDLHSVRVGTVASSEAADFLHGQRIEFETFATLEEGLRAVNERQVDAFVYDRPLLAWQINRSFRTTLDLLDPVFDKQNYGIALPTGSALREPLDQAILAETRSDWWKRMTHEYIGESPDHRIPSASEGLLGHGHH
ncbi:transporter substrate-binding domain-containing protein [Rhodoligotrophos ferricapiens]|uniref:transporter substrate-binding domain-containing protein n=1 Tax=Rhodoligotrophos ferricapiens TaxID=3069264 RepID=UPI00315D2923